MKQTNSVMILTNGKIYKNLQLKEIILYVFLLGNISQFLV